MAPSFESQVREFAAEFNTPNVRRALALCESGRLTWEQVAKLFAASLREGFEAVGA